MQGALWEAVDRLIDRVPEPGHLVGHRLHLLAAHRWRQQGAPVPGSIVLDELRVLARIRASHELLRVMQEAYDGPIMVLKGLEIAAHYPAPEMRMVHDLDILVEDAEGAFAAAVAAGLQPVGPEERYFSGLHHVRPLVDPEQRSVLLEIHRRPNWVPWELAPSARELFAGAEPSQLGIPGILAPPADQHAVIAAAHSWGEVPLRRLSDLVDVLALLGDGDRAAADATAARWGLQRMWRATVLAAESVLLDRPRPPWLTVLAPDVVEVRERTVFENHVRTWMGPLLALPPRAAVAELGHALRSEIGRNPGETWSQRRHRVWEGFQHLNRPNSEHRNILQEKWGGSLTAIAGAGSTPR